MAGPRSLAAASAELARLDPVMAELVAVHGPVRLGGWRRASDRFEALASSIVYQQLAGRAAAAIWARVRGLVEGPFDAESVLALSDDQLRGAGLSRAKAASLRDLARHVADGTVDLTAIGRADDEEVIRRLVIVRGIGRWTAEMFLIFTLGRRDVWPTADLGVRAGYARAYGLAALPTAAELEPLGEPFRPYRSLAAWYCWRAVETVVPG